MEEADPQGSQPPPPTATAGRRLPAMVLLDRTVSINLQSEQESSTAAPPAAAAASGGAAARKEWPPKWVRFLSDNDDEAPYFLGVLEGTDPRPRLQVADPGDGFTSLSLTVVGKGWPRNRYGHNHPNAALIVGCHKNLLLLSIGDIKDGFFMVYNAKQASSSSSIAIVPRRVRISMTHFPVARIPCLFLADLAVLRLSNNDDYLLAELLFRTEDRSGAFPTNKATLFLWRSCSDFDDEASFPVVCSPYICLTPDKVPPFPRGDLAAHALQWIPLEVELPLPTDKDNHPSFRSDMTLAAGSTSLICWVDLIQGILVYNHHRRHRRQPVHFIPLPPEADPMETHSNAPQFRSMCCIKDGSLKFVSMEGFGRIPMAEVVLITWILTNPHSPTGWKWELFDAVHIGDLWHDPHYSGLPLGPHYPIISTVEPHVIYFRLNNYKCDQETEEMEPTEEYMIGIDMHLRGVVSAFKCSSPPQWMLTSHFTRYLNQRTVCPMEKEVADEGDPAAWASVWISTKPIRVSPVEPAHKASRLGGRASSGGVVKFISKTGLTMSSISPVVGMECVLGH